MEAHNKLTEFSDGFETLYYQCQVDCLHFVWPSIHTLSHLAPETEQVGPGIIYSQWSMEWTIGNLGEEIKQHSNAFANLAQRGIWHCQVNALKAMIPDLEPPTNHLPQGSYDLGENYILLTARDTSAREVDRAEAVAICQYLWEVSGEEFIENQVLSVVWWARVCLPNGQIVRSHWKEGQKSLQKICTSWNIKVDDIVVLCNIYTHI